MSGVVGDQGHSGLGNLSRQGRCFDDDMARCECRGG